ncbi:MAG: hypothetical protein ACRD6I_18045, partial [Candidatus Acidiferrales bacterium]
ARRTELQAAQAEGRNVILHVVVATTWQDTNKSESGFGIGDVMVNARAEHFEILYEGQTPKPYTRSKRGGLAGDLLRSHTGTTLTQEEYDFVLEGTDPDAAARRLDRQLIDVKLRHPGGGKTTPFEYLIVEALQNGRSLDPLRDYAIYRRELAEKHPSAGPAFEEITRWYDMEKLIDGPMEDLIAAAKAQNISLDLLRATAKQRIAEASESSDGGRGAAVYARWSEVLRLIDEK